MHTTSSDIGGDLKSACALALHLYGRRGGPGPVEDWHGVVTLLQRTERALVAHDTAERSAATSTLSRLATAWRHRQNGNARAVRSLMRRVDEIRDGRDGGPLIFIPALCRAELVAARLLQA